MIIDDNISEESGLKFVKFLRQGWQYFDLPVLLISEQSDLDTNIHTLSAGCQDFVVKAEGLQMLAIRLYRVLRSFHRFNIKRQYPYSNKPIQTLTPDQMLQYLEWKVQQHIPECNSKEYLLKRVTAVTETNSKFERLNNYVKLLSQ